ncbi:uncharacterized protein JCM6883_006094 [Sporobolomyces salmoneus]|uniref:uncharacterized protein n=1 Tax=Sporobolomyces salmoneus TaxID=183962 RepID=UPI0031728EE7
MTICYAPLAKEHVQRAYELESASYPSDEAASLASLEYRQEHASNYFLGAYQSEDDQLVGFICSTRTSSSTLTHESMETHEPTGAYLAIHSVCVSPDHRKQGIAKNLLQEYVKRVQAAGEVKGIRLIAKEGLVGMYERTGFKSRGKSEVVHGKDPWFELAVDFEAENDKLFETDKDIDPASIRTPGKRLASTITKETLRRELVEDGKNRFDLYCPRAECRCLLVKRGTAKWVVKGTHDNELELPPLPRRIDAPSPSSSSSSSSHLGYWTLSSPLAFENIGFTRSLPSSSSSSQPSTSPSAAQIKYLTCADCDFGPLGWHDTEGRDLGVEVQEENEGGGEVRKGREFLVDLERVRYKQD